MKTLSRILLTVLLGLTALTASPLLAEQPVRSRIVKQTRPAPLAGFTDEGAFHIYLDEEQVGNIQFQWKTDGAFENKVLAGKTVQESLTIAPHEDGTWSKITDNGQKGLVVAARKGSELAIKVAGQDVSIELREGTVLFDLETKAPALLSQVIRGYDHAKGGKQSFPLISPGIQGVLEAHGQVERTVGCRKLKLTRYLYDLPQQGNVIVWADTAGKVYFAELPVQRMSYVREGFEALRQRVETDPFISQPKHDVKVERGVSMPMRDGVKLSTDIYRPQADGKFPVILIRTPYRKEYSHLDGMYYARRGYVVAIQDVRGRFGSPGEWEPFVHEPKDGYDAIEWLAAQPWSTGKVGMIGASYLGWVQWWALSQNPPHLVTIIPNVSPPDPFHNVPYEGGVFKLGSTAWWCAMLDEANGEAIFTKLMERKDGKLQFDVPVVELDKQLLGKVTPHWRKWIEHSKVDDYWAPVHFSDMLKDARIPVFHQSGYFDGDGIGAKLNYLKMAEHGHPNQKMIYGPWGHTDIAQRGHLGRDFSSAATPDLKRMYVRWFDYWLKGVGNDPTKEPLVGLFVMGSNRWATGERYPLPQTKFDKWYLASGGKANTTKGDGRLTRELPKKCAAVDRYTYDPADPTLHPNVDKEADNRQDVLVYVTEPFKERYTFAGPVSAVLYASSTARDTDWFMWLSEVDEKGQKFPLVEGKIRARFRKSVKAPELIEPGQVYEYQLDLWQTGLTVAPGRRLRIEVASSAYPIFSRNLNTGGHNETETRSVPAQQTIYHSADYPSHVLLPAIPEPTAKTPNG